MPKIVKPVMDDPKTLQRRKLMRNMMMGGAALVGASAVGAPAVGAPAAPAGMMPSRTSGMPVWNVMDFGARADGKHDNTLAFQTALDLAGSAGGGTVYAPAGKYLFAGVLKFPTGVTLQGTFSWPPYHMTNFNLAANPGGLNPALAVGHGTTLMPTAGRGSETGPPFIDLTQPNTCVKGLVIWYVDQDPTQAPAPYPWTIFMGNYGAAGTTNPDYTVDAQGDQGYFGSNSAAIDIELMFAYNGILIESNGRSIVKNVMGTPLRRGVYVNHCEDVPRIETVHFHQANIYNSPMDDFFRANLEAFVYGRADWGYMSDCFCLFANIAYHFIDAMSDVLIQQCGADGASTAIQVDNCIGDWGISWEGGKFDGNIVVSPSNSGPVRFSHCSFLGGGVNLAGSGRVAFTNCHFMEGISVTQCPVMINSCDLGGNTINLDSSVPVATIVGNQGLGGIAGTPSDLEASSNSSS